MKPELSYASLFEALPGNHILVQNDAPKFTILAATQHYLKQTGYTKGAIVGKGVFEAFADTNDLNKTGEYDLLSSYLYVSTNRLPHFIPVRRYDLKNKEGAFIEKYWQISNIPVLAPNGEVEYIIHTPEDITARILFEQTEGRGKSMEHAYNLFMQAPTAICIFTGPELILDLANPPTLEIWGRQSDVRGKRFAEFFPELQDQGYDVMMQEVMQTGIAKTFYEVPLTVKRTGRSDTSFFNFIYQPYYEKDELKASSVLVFATEVTDQVQAKNKFRSLVEEAPVATCLFVGKELRIEVANQMMIELWGKGSHVLGLPLSKAIPELKGQHFLPLLAELFETGNIYEARGDRADLMVNDVLTTFYFDYSFKPLRDENGDVYAIMQMAIDVSDQVIARQKLEEAEEALRSAVEIAQLGTWSIDVATGGLTYSDRLIEWFGYDPAARNFHEVIPILSDEDQERVAEAVARALAPGATHDYDETYAVIHPETGKRRILHAQGRVVYDHQGKPVNMIGTAQDVTIQQELQLALENKVQERTVALETAYEALQISNGELTEANRVMEKINKELARSNQSLEEFAHAASHDLKEPVRKVQMFTSQLKEQLSGHLSEDEAMMFARIGNATERMRNLIDDLLLYSHLSEEPLQMKTVDLNDRLNQVFEDLELDIEEKKAVLRMEKLPVVMGYKRQLQQLFQNLISNALKYSKADIPPEIRITASLRQIEGQQFHLISVIDNGIGFEQQYDRKIFQMFARLHGKSKYSGTGLGLSIAKKVVENHNGMISVDSVPGKGSTFNVMLPYNNQ